MQSETEAEKDEIFCHLLKKGLGRRWGECLVPSSPFEVGRVWDDFFCCCLKKKMKKKKQKGKVNLKRETRPKRCEQFGACSSPPRQTGPTVMTGIDCFF